MKDVQVVEVIVSRLKQRGSGTSTPIRDILQVYDKDGTLIAENDYYLYELLHKLVKGNEAISDVTPHALDNIIQEIKKII